MARKMKDSGVEWIGEIPEDWEVKRTRFIADSLSKGNGITKEDVDENGDIQCIRYGEIYSKYDSSVENTESRTKLDAISTPKHIKKGDILFTCTGELVEEIGKNIVYMGDSPCLAGGDIIVMEHKEDPLFLNYALNCSSSQAQKSSGKTKLKVVHISAGEIGNVCVALPPIEEQKRLSAFISRKCASIDSIIEKTRASIEEYKKLRQAFILKSVTKGVRNDQFVKDSGIEWIGEINQRYELKRIKSVVDILDQYRKPISSENRNQESDVLYDYFGASGAIDKIDGYTIDDHVMLIGEDGANLRLRNLPLMYEVNGKAWINNHAHILKPKEGVDFYYVFYALEALDINTYITGSAQPKLSQENLRNIWIPFPCYNEQIEISRCISNKTKAIDSIIDRKQAELTEIENLKKSFIYEYVTGKKEVPA